MKQGPEKLDDASHQECFYSRETPLYLTFAGIRDRLSVAEGR
jgi:hypothetical protein